MDLQDGRGDRRQDALSRCQCSLQLLKCEVPRSWEPARFSRMFPRCTPDIGGTGAYWLGQNTETEIFVRWLPRIARDIPDVLEGFSLAIVLAEEAMIGESFSLSSCPPGPGKVSMTVRWAKTRLLHALSRQ
jgi:hypothetical protein